MENKKREVWSVGDLLSRSKNTSYREGIIRRETIIFKYFFDNDLIKINPFGDNGQVKPDLIVYADDLTLEGLKLLSWEDCAPDFKMLPVLKWYNYLDGGGKEENISHLTKGLNQLRKK